RLSRPQSQREVPGLDQRPGPTRDSPDPPRDEKERRRRAGHRPCEGRAPNEPQLSQGTRRRPHQCRPGRRRLQLRPPAALAGEAFACPRPNALGSATGAESRLIASLVPTSRSTTSPVSGPSHCTFYEGPRNPVDIVIITAVSVESEAV